MPCSRVKVTSPREVVDALPLEALELVGEVADPVREPVGQARLAEAAVAAAGPEGDVSASRTTTRSAGSVSVRAIAVQSPVNPAADDRDIRAVSLTSLERRVGRRRRLRATSS